MKIYRSIDDFITINNAVVTTGTFDGVHLGHREILSRLNKIAKEISGESVLLTFFPHPRMVLFPDNKDLKLLNTLDEKIELLEKAGVNHLIIQEFTKEFSRYSSIEFVRNILVNKIGTKKLVIGHDHRFGRNREGSFEHLKEFGPLYGFDVEEIPKQQVDEVAVSSTKIRNAIMEGDMTKAANYLGYHFFITGIVEEGEKMGRKLGYPTANISIREDYKLIPLDGVYAVKVEVKNESFYGMMNIGVRPTFNGKRKTVEVNIFNFDKEIYNEKIRVSFIEYIRPEIKFDGVDHLKQQLNRDMQKAQKIVSEC